MRVSIGIGLIGCGTVGSAVAKRLLGDAARLSERAGVALELRGVAARRPGGRDGIPQKLLTTDADAIVDDPDVDLLVECMGGTEIAADVVERALLRGAHVVTANKDLIATQGPRLLALARASNASLSYEAAVCGGIPVIRAIRDSLAADDVTEISGVLNGTTTAILSAMEEGASFAAALADAQRRGYAEPDPRNDVEGIDAAHKLAILMQLAFGAAVTTPMIAASGISQIAQRDIARAASLDCRIRLVAAARRTASGFAASVGPALVPMDHPFARTTGPLNAVQIVARDAGELTFCGPGAGGAATGSAVLGDIVHSARAIRQRMDPARYYPVLEPAICRSDFTQGAA